MKEYIAVNNIPEIEASGVFKQVSRFLLKHEL